MSRYSSGIPAGRTRIILYLKRKLIINLVRTQNRNSRSRSSRFSIRHVWIEHLSVDASVGPFTRSSEGREVTFPVEKLASLAKRSHIVASQFAIQPRIRVCQIVRSGYVCGCTCSPGSTTCAIPSAIGNIRERSAASTLYRPAFPLAVLASTLVLVSWA